MPLLYGDEYESKCDGAVGRTCVAILRHSSATLTMFKAGDAYPCCDGDARKGGTEGIA
jgi:hypothetical protein